MKARRDPSEEAGEADSGSPAHLAGRWPHLTRWDFALPCCAQLEGAGHYQAELAVTGLSASEVSNM